MKENFLAYLWKSRLLPPTLLKTTAGEKVELLDPGQENTDAGPDFFAARIRIDDTLWVGNVEIHINTSDWLKHGHDKDPAYDNIVLHVVYEHDSPTATSSGKFTPVLEVKNIIDKTILKNYQQLISNKNWVSCQDSIKHVDPFFISNWLSRLLVERLERKAEEISRYLSYFANDWEQTFYILLAQNFGFKVNSSAFGLMAQRTPFSILAKNRNNSMVIESILFGQSGLLDASYKDVYPKLLLREYLYQKKKHNLKPVEPQLWRFARLRPVNFPTIRIAQFSSLLSNHDRLFRKLMQAREPEQIITFFNVKASPYWHAHYSFDKPSKRTEKRLGTDSIYNLIINTIAPVQFVYGEIIKDSSLKENAVSLFQKCPPEVNSTITRWEELGINPENSADTQGLLEMKKYYCTPRKCLKCAIGHLILKRND